jgi:hypothetical protein
MKRLAALFLGISWTGTGYVAKTTVQKALKFRKKEG